MKGKKILITRPESESKDFKQLLEKEGAEVDALPMIRFEGINLSDDLKATFNQLDKFDWLVFTSAKAVQFFFEAAAMYEVKFYFYPNLKIATVGEKTKLKLEQLGYRTNFVPIKYTAEVLAENVDDVNGKNILIPRSNLASEEYISVFAKRGAAVFPLTVYNNIPVSYSKQQLETLLNQKLDYLTFTSGSTFKAFHQLLVEHELQLNDEKIICIGPSTANVVSTLNYTVTAVASTHTVEGIIDTIKQLEENV